MNDTENIEWKVEGMTCTNCALGIEKYLKSTGNETAKVDFASKSVQFLANENTNLDQIKHGIQQLGFKIIDQQKPNNPWADNKDLLFKIIVCSVFTLPLLLSMFLPFEWLHSAGTQLFLCLPVALIGLEHFGKKTFYSLKSGVLNMDVLILLGAGAAFVYSFIGYWQNLGHNYLFFETCATIFTVVLIGNYIEQWTLRKTTDAITSLVKLQAKTAKIITNLAFNEWEEIAIDRIQKNDILLIQNGDIIPVDGELIQNSGLIDEALLTGESNYISKNIGDKVFAGSVVMEGPFVIKAQKIGTDTSLQKIINLVKKAQSEKPDIQKFADKISAVFIPLVLAIAFFCFLLNYYLWALPLQTAIMRTIAVLVVACPCAMGLATPTAVIVGVSRLSKVGMLINNGQLIEELAKVKQIVFDKTGTLTSGNFNIQKANSTVDAETFKSILKGLESHSAHPLAKSISAKLANQTALQLVSVEEIKGLGVLGKDQQGNSYALGSYSLAKDQTTDNSHSIYVLKNQQLIGWLDMEDELKPTVKETIAALKADGFELFLLSGDRQAKTQLIAQEVGIETYFAEQLPAQKLEILETLMQKGKTMMVGDGINDAPALVKANVGISLGNASEVAINSADGILLNKDFTKLHQAIKISKATSICIKQNLFWAFFYNILMIPLAIVGILHPMFAALAMAFSDVFVIGNALRLKYKKIE